MKRIVFALVAIVVVGLWAAGNALPRIERRLLEAPPSNVAGRTVLYEVKKGATAQRVAQELEQRKLIRSAWAFRRMLRDHGWEGKLQPGIYRVPQGTTAQEIARMMVEHDTWKLRVTLPEGLTLRQIAERIEAAGAVEGGQWLPKAEEIKAAASAEHLRKVTGLSIPTKLAEGYLFPDTYYFPAGSSASSVVERMMQEFVNRFVLPYREEIRRQKLSLHELVTLASIVEGEAASDQERPLVAQVFLNRLAIGMKLESCATVQYALPQRKPRLLKRDTLIPSPYNTYLHPGLPPGPICSPGEASLLAALRPQKTDALYFVARGDGRHIFSRTYAEHLAAIRRIRGGQAQNAPSKGAAQ